MNSNEATLRCKVYSFVQMRCGTLTIVDAARAQTGEDWSMMILLLLLLLLLLLDGKLRNSDYSRSALCCCSFRGLEAVDEIIRHRQDPF